MQNTKGVLKLGDFNLSSRVLLLLARNNIDRVKLTSISYNELKRSKHITIHTIIWVESLIL